MSKPRYPWWQYAKNIIRQYPALKKMHDKLHRQSITPSTSGIQGGGGVSRGTENTALRTLPGKKQLELDAVQQAIEATARLTTGNDRLKMIDIVFWKESHTLSGAAYAIGISYDTAINYHGDFIMLVAYFRGLIEEEELRAAQKIALKSQKDMLK